MKVVRTVNYLLIVCLFGAFLLVYLYGTTLSKLLYVLFYSAVLGGGYLSSWEIKETFQELGVGILILIGFTGLVYVVFSQMLEILPL